MKNILLGFIAILLFPVVVVVAIAGLSGILVKGVASAAEAESVNGFTLGELKDFELKAVGGSDTQFYPLSKVLSSFDRQASTLALGRDIEPQSGHVVLAPADYVDVIAYYDEILAADGWVKVGVPTPMVAFGAEQTAVTWRKQNVVFRLVKKTDGRLLVEAGGSGGDTVYEYLVSPLFPVDG
jgi:hypothetical protein